MLAVAFAMASCVQAGAQQDPPPSVSPDQGAIDAAGKFVPKGDSVVRSPEEAAAEEAKQRAASQVLPDGPGRFRIGAVSFDRTRREVTIPATVNMDEGVVEYALVEESGKAHEALFTTKAKSREIHLACLLLGLAVEDEKTPVDAGVEVKVHVSWDTNGPSPLHELANLVVTADSPAAIEDAKPLPAGPWRYVSSQMTPGGFAASMEGSVISLIHDPSALVVNPRDSAAKDDHHMANHRLIPPKGSPVRIVITLPPPPAKP